jgi:hypothetical protein
MKHIIDRALSEMRNTSPTDDQVQQAAGRVLAKLEAEHNKVVFMPAAAAGERIQSCEDFQSLIPAYRSGSLSASRKLLFEDHVNECVACRNTLKGVKPAPTRAVYALRPQRLIMRPAVLVAAAVLLVVALSQRNTIRDFVFPIDVHAVAESVSGGLFRVSGQEIRSVSAGERIDRYQAVRTGTDSGAVLKLADGSSIEMNARSELSLDRARDGVRIQLSRGGVIVTAAKQRQGHLYVATTDCVIAVVGTVFSVTAGTKGSRVSVIEGQVQVQQGSSSQSLLPGQQVATDTLLGTVPIEEEIAWSRDRDLHMAMLKELITFGQDVAQRLSALPLRQPSDLLALVPANTIVFVSLPNISQPVAESFALMKQRLAENPALQSWWNSKAAAPGDGISMDEIVERLTRLGSSLGREIIIAGADTPLLLADVAQPETLVNDFAELARMSAERGGPQIHIVHSAAELDAIAGARDLVIYIDQKRLVAAPSVQQVRTALAGTGGFSTTSLYRQVAQSYANGVGWLVAADLSGIGRDSSTPPGLADIQQVVIEQNIGASGAAYQAVLGFNQARSGIAAWLAEPGPIGATEFLSPNTYGAAAIVTKDPALILDDVFGMLQNDAKALYELKEFQQEHHLDLRYDIASRIGNEFLIAVDGPILPTPAWKVVLEVTDAARLQNTIQVAITEINREAAARQAAGITASMEVVDGRTYYALKSAAVPTEVHYTFWAGYMILAPARALLVEAIQYHDSGMSLARSERFRSQFPADGRDNASGFVYQNIQSAMNAIPVPVPNTRAVESFKQAVGNALPSLVCLYGDTDRITVSSKAMLSANIANLAGLTGMMQAIGIH